MIAALTSINNLKHAFGPTRNDSLTYGRAAIVAAMLAESPFRCFSHTDVGDGIVADR
jgi:hypothetical protein